MKVNFVFFFFLWNHIFFSTLIDAAKDKLLTSKSD